MNIINLGNSGLDVTPVALGTWAIGGDAWWGPQEDGESANTIKEVIKAGINFIDTAPVYGKGRSETVIGKTLKRNNLREKVILATKTGLSWKGPKIFHNLKRKRILEEIEESRKRLRTDIIDLYQVHWPDPDIPIRETAETMYELYKNGKVRSIGVSNYSVSQIEEFILYCPVHSVQPPYNMFRREAEKDLIPYCIDNDIAVIAYAPLHSGVLTGKFFFGKNIPNDRIRNINPDLKGKRFHITKEIILKLREIAIKYNKTLTQLVINWTISQKGITSAIVGARRKSQVTENAKATGWTITENDMQKIEEILKEREQKIKH